VFPWRSSLSASPIKSRSATRGPSAKLRWPRITECKIGIALVGHGGAYRARDDMRDHPPRAAPLSSASRSPTGGDNISTYTPLFQTVGLADSLVTVAVFVPLVAAWCLAGGWLGSHKQVIALAQRFGRWIVPIVLILIGAVIITETGAFAALLH
jgi:hypothetical protein